MRLFPRTTRTSEPVTSRGFYFVAREHARRNLEVGLFETLVVYRLQQENSGAVVQRIVYVEKCEEEAFDLLVIQAPRHRSMRHFEKPEFVRRKERFTNSLQAVQCAGLLMAGYLKDGWKLVGQEQLAECGVS